MQPVRFVLPLVLVLVGCAGDPAGDDIVESHTEALTSPAPVGDIIATAFKDPYGRHYINALPGQTLSCFKTFLDPGCPVARVYFGSGGITSATANDAEANFADPSVGLASIRVILTGHMSTVTVTDHRTNTTSTQTWFVVSKVYRSPESGSLWGIHSTSFFYGAGSTSSAQLLLLGTGNTNSQAATLSWAAGVAGPAVFSDLFLTGTYDPVTRALSVVGDQYFVRQL